MPSTSIMIVIDSLTGSIGSKNVHTPGYLLGPLVPVVCGAVVVLIPSEHVRLCSDKCAFIVYYAGGVCKIIVVVRCVDHHAVVANIIGDIAPTPPLPMVYTT